MHVPRGCLRCPLCLVKYIFQDTDSSLQLSATRHVYMKYLPNETTINGRYTIDLEVSFMDRDRFGSISRSPICLNAN